MGSSDYRLAPFWDKDGNLTKEDVKLGWLREGIQEGSSFLKSQRAYADMDRAIDLLYGPEDERIPRTLSKVHVNRLKRQIRDQIATLSNLRPIWGYKSDNREVEAQTVELNKLMNAWFHGTYADRSLRAALQYAGVEGTGYASPMWEKDFWVTGRGDIKLHTYGPRDILPIQLPRDHDLQRAYAVVMRTEIPIGMAHAMYPYLADRIRPDRTQPAWFRRGMKKVQRFLSPALNVADQDRDREVSCPTVDLYNVYILDLTINNTGRLLPMGDPGTNWYYEVPYLGMDIPAGVNDGQGRPLVRKATWEDCLLYPSRRLFTATNTVECKDGPSPWWHRKVPVVKFTLDDWVFEFLGLSLVRDGASIQGSINKLLRVVDDSANARLRPPLAYDENAVSKTAMDQFDTRQPNKRVAVNMAMGEAIKPLLGAEYYDVPGWIAGHIQSLKDDLSYVMAHGDMLALARARQLPAAESIEKLFEILGPIPQDQSRSMEMPIRELGEMVKYLFFQWYTLPRTIQITGSTSKVEEWHDYDPGTMIPARSPEEAMQDYFQRVRRHADKFVFHVAPFSAHQITQVGRQMILMQLFRAGYPIDPWTLAKAFDLQDFGPEPEGTKNVIERWVAWIRMRGEIMGQMQAEAAQAAQAGGLAAALAPLTGAAPPGRPPSGTVPPHIVQKEGGERATVAESR